MSMEFLSDDANGRHAEQGCINMYDVRLRDTYPSCGMSWPPDLTDVTPYLRVLPLPRPFFNLLASGCSEGSEYRYQQEEVWLARMFRRCIRGIPRTQVSSRHRPPSISSRNRSYPPIQRRPGPHLQSSGYRRNDISHDLAQRHRLRRS